MICIISFILWHKIFYRLIHIPIDLKYGRQGRSESVHLSPQEHEWALLHRGWQFELRLGKSTVIPELEPVEVVGAELDVILVPMVLEEEHFVTPEGGCCLRARHDVTKESFLTTVLRRRVVTKDLEHNSVGWNVGELVEEVVLIFVSPSINIIRLALELERPVRLLFLITVLVKLSKFHNRHGTSVVRDFG